jgi:hypothetical protein
MMALGAYGYALASLRLGLPFLPSMLAGACLASIGKGIYRSRMCSIRSTVGDHLLWTWSPIFDLEIFGF